jgi:hypothetical protein
MSLASGTSARQPCAVCANPYGYPCTCAPAGPSFCLRCIGKHIALEHPARVAVDMRTAIVDGTLSAFRVISRAGGELLTDEVARLRRIEAAARAVVDTGRALVATSAEESDENDRIMDALAEVLK